MTSIKNIAIIILLSILLKGCFASKSFVNFEILQPAEFTYPENVSKVGLLNRAPVSQDAFLKINVENLDYKGIQIMDTLVCNNLIKGFLEASKGYDLPYLKNIQTFEARRSDTINKSGLMDDALKQNIFDDYGLDALVVLEYYFVGMNSSYSYFDYSLMDYVQEYIFLSDILWRVYTENSDKPLDEYNSLDTLYYRNLSRTPRDEQLRGTSIVRDATTELGYRYGTRHIPVWTEVGRVVFRGGNDQLRSAAGYTDKGEWDKAVQIWSSLLTNEKTKVAAVAMNNLAIYYELQDDLETANYYAQEALKLWDNNTIENYSQEIGIRLLNKNDIYKQLRQ